MNQYNMNQYNMKSFDERRRIAFNRHKKEICDRNKELAKILISIRNTEYSYHKKIYNDSHNSALRCLYHNTVEESDSLFPALSLVRMKFQQM